MPYTIDVTPQVTVTANGPMALADGTVVELDVDRNGDFDFGDPGELAHTQSTLFGGAATFEVTPGLDRADARYSVNLRARVKNPNGVVGASPLVALGVDTLTSDALENYVHAPDPSYGYTVANTVDADGYTFYALDMTSQTWRSAAEVNKPVWRHWVEVIVPDGAIDQTAMLFITGGNNNFGAPPSTPDQSMLLTALATHTVTVRLRTVPSEPLIFTDETRTRSEDEIIAYSFDKFLEHIGQPGNDTWPLLLAMAKSAVAAMDTIQDFIPQVRPGSSIDDFVVTGYSKRGWTTWLTAASDDRVRAIIPA
jgi:PhoPQ-activated pathogenicity-related protein